MHTLLLLTTLWTGLLAPGDNKVQRTYLGSGMEVTTRGKAQYYLIPAGQEGSAYVGRIYTMDDVLRAQGHYSDAALKVEHGHFIFYHPDGAVESEGDYVMGNKSGVWKRFDRWGQALAEKVYDHKPLENIVYTQVPTMPHYPGGDEAMVTYLTSKVPAAHGVTATFIVEKDGDLSNIKVLGAAPAVADQLAQALEKAPQFAVGEKDGVVVRVQMRVPLK
jgi:antitoxin component YwqK of YwqJK toxin-antitoxin module